jgi:hypothetical protein
VTIELGEGTEPVIEIRRVEYDHEAWARKMEAAGIKPVFVEPVRTGIWTTGVASLPASERHRFLRAGSPVGSRKEPAWKPESLDLELWKQTLGAFRSLDLLSEEELAEALALHDPAFPFFEAIRLADSVHLHIKVHDTEALPHGKILRLGTHAENARPGYVKYPFAGGINLIFSSIPIAEEDQLPDPRLPKPFADHFGVDLRREIGIVRAAFEDTPDIARRAGWIYKTQGGLGRVVYCCHATVAEKYWVYPPAEGARWTRPIEFAYGPLKISQEMNGCDLRPIDPRHPSAAKLAECAPPTPH